jgi:hypothetical protein
MTDPRTEWMDTLLLSEDPQIDSYAVAVAFALYQHMRNKSVVCRPSVRRLATMARCSPNVVTDRVNRLESAGFLTVERRTKAASTYTGVCASVAPDDTDGSVHLSHGVTQTDEGNCASDSHGETDGNGSICASVASESESVAPGATEPRNQGITSSRTQTTHARPKRHWEPRTEPGYEKGQRVTRPMLWRMMAWRRLELDRESGREGLPPIGSYRELRLLETLEADFETQHDAKALDLQGKLPGNDLERWIYALVPELAKCGWGPILAAGNAQHARWQAECDEKMAQVTDEEREAITQGLRELRENIRSGRHLQSVPEAS